MHCPDCGDPNIKVLDSRPSAGNVVRRRRGCRCGYRWTTIEHIIERVVRAPIDEVLLLVPEEII